MDRTKTGNKNKEEVDRSRGTDSKDKDMNKANKPFEFLLGKYE
ncbi:hypothetical protein JCM16418A_09060 [Paenibacillus pini]